MYYPILTLSVFVYLYKTITRMYGTNQDNVRKCSYSFLKISVAIMMFVIYLLNIKPIYVMGSRILKLMLNCYLCFNEGEWHFEIGAHLLFLIQWNWSSIGKPWWQIVKLEEACCEVISFAIHIAVHFSKFMLLVRCLLSDSLFFLLQHILSRTTSRLLALLCLD